jgi:hypothetical protein
MLNLVRFWILLSTVLVGGGWVLSALDQLNRLGYITILLPLFVGTMLWCRKSGLLTSEHLQRCRHKFRKRFRRRAPQLFLLIAVLSFIGGCLYPPLNYDANAYRLPRIMHWLAAGQWHWIHVFDQRMNIAACGMEWLDAPLILFSRSDRLMFLANWIPYLMLPGLLFSVFTRVQVSPRTAWWWTWWVSGGLCYVLQAGSIANDGFATIYILAAVDLALRARESKSVFDLWLSLLAAALVTGVKQTNIPLVALWCVAAWPARSLLWQNPLRTVAVAALALLVSIIPISLINYRHCGAWLPLEVTGVANLGQFHLNPFWGAVGNAFCIPVQNLVPPFYSLMPPCHSYWAVLWNEEMRHFLQTSFGAHFRSFENFGLLTEAYYRGLCEANAGIGLGICLVILAAISERRALKKSGRLATASLPPAPLLALLRFLPWLLLLVFMAKVGTAENARHLAPYYPFLFLAWLARPGQSQVTRVASWQKLGHGMMVIAALLVAASNERPLFPSQTVFRYVQAHFRSSDFLSDECVHYLESAYRAALARRNFLEAKLPPDEMVVGYYDKMTTVDEPGIWLPFGRHRVECLLPDEPSARLRALGIHYAVLNGSTILTTYGGIEKWTAKYNAVLVDQYAFPNSLRQPSDPPDLYIVRLN